MMVGSCVTTMILFVSNLSFKHFFEKPLYAHNNNVYVGSMWAPKYDMDMVRYEDECIPPPTDGIDNFMKWWREMFFQQLSF